ncbi:MAG TPA: hypothetical protein VK851_03965, partial [Anaerolineales bacterium]|nr:hypothetical protein [Anaerolineales bacterium]
MSKSEHKHDQNSSHNKQPEHMDHSMHEMPIDHAGHKTEMSHEDHSAHARHDEHAGHGTDHSGHEQMFRTRFWGSLLLSIPVLIFSPALQNWLGYTATSFTVSTWFPFIFSLVFFAYGGVPFLNMS